MIGQSRLGVSEDPVVEKVLTWLARAQREDEIHPRRRRRGGPALCALFGIISLAVDEDVSGAGLPPAPAGIAGSTVPLLTTTVLSMVSLFWTS
jgi:hypothetical protein